MNSTGRWSGSAASYGALLIFDEVVTAFRLGLSGAQGYFGVDPDLTVFGKVVAGGYPSAGGIGGKKEYMKYLAAGIKGGEKHKKALVGGTMAANPLSCVAGYYTICEIERTGAAQQAGRMGDRLTRGMQELITKLQSALCGFQPGFHCPPGDRGDDAFRHRLEQALAHSRDN